MDKKWYVVDDGIFTEDDVLVCEQPSEGYDGHYLWNGHAKMIIDSVNNRARLEADKAELVKALEEMTNRYERLDKKSIAGQHNDSNGTIDRARTLLARMKG